LPSRSIIVALIGLDWRARRTNALQAPHSSPIHVAPVIPKPVSIDPDEARNAQAGKVLGDWLGSGVLPERGPCRLSIQIRPDPSKVGGYSAYTTTACNPTFMTMGQDRQKAMDTLLKGATPTSTIMLRLDSER